MTLQLETLKKKRGRPKRSASASLVERSVPDLVKLLPKAAPVVTQELRSLPLKTKIPPARKPLNVNVIKDRESHNALEKRRKAKLNQLIGNLGALLPVKGKKSKIAILEETVKLIEKQRNLKRDYDLNFWLEKVKSLELIIVKLLNLLKENAVNLPSNIQVIDSPNKFVVIDTSNGVKQPITERDSNGRPIASVESLPVSAKTAEVQFTSVTSNSSETKTPSNDVKCPSNEQTCDSGQTNDDSQSNFAIERILVSNQPSVRSRLPSSGHTVAALLDTTCTAVKSSVINEKNDAEESRVNTVKRWGNVISNAKNNNILLTSFNLKPSKKTKKKMLKNKAKKRKSTADSSVVLTNEKPVALTKPPSVVRSMKDRTIKNKWLNVETSNTTTSQQQCISPVISFKNTVNRRKRPAAAADAKLANQSCSFSAESLSQSANVEQAKQTVQLKNINKLQHPPDIPFGNSLPTILNIFAPASVPASSDDTCGGIINDSLSQFNQNIFENQQLLNTFPPVVDHSTLPYAIDNLIAQDNNTMPLWNNSWLPQDIADPLFVGMNNLQNGFNRNRSSTECSPIKSIMSIIQSTPANQQGMQFHAQNEDFAMHNPALVNNYNRFNIYKRNFANRPAAKTSNMMWQQNDIMQNVKNNFGKGNFAQQPQPLKKPRNDLNKLGPTLGVHSLVRSDQI